MENQHGVSLLLLSWLGEPVVHCETNVAAGCCCVASERLCRLMLPKTTQYSSIAWRLQKFKKSTRGLLLFISSPVYYIHIVHLASLPLSLFLRLLPLSLCVFHGASFQLYGRTYFVLLLLLFQSPPHPLLAFAMDERTNERASGRRTAKATQERGGDQQQQRAATAPC